MMASEPGLCFVIVQQLFFRMLFEVTHKKNKDNVAVWNCAVCSIPLKQYLLFSKICENFKKL